MKENAKKIRLTICILVCLLNMACGARWMVKGQVVDAQTSYPIEGAAVYIYWGKRGAGPPGLAAETVEVEVAEDLTDIDGEFSVPKYWPWFIHYHMAVYKKGYVCWSTRKIFPALEERRDFRLKNGMIIKLERFKEEYSKVQHAHFALTSSTHRPGLGVFNEAMKSELELLRNIKQKKKKRRSN